MINLKNIYCRVCGKRLEDFIDPKHICIPQTKWRTGKGARPRKIQPWQLLIN